MPDPLSHILIAYSFYKLARMKKHLHIFLFSTLLPDLDIIPGIIEAYLNNDPSLIFKYHPTFGASLLFLPFLTLVYAFLFSKIKNTSVKELYLIILISQLLHIFVDFIHYGNKPFWPFDVEFGLGLVGMNVRDIALVLIFSLLIAILSFLISEKK